MHFETHQFIFLLGSILFFSLAFIAQIKNKEKWMLLFLTATGFCIFSFAALLDPFLNLWDERFHALVAKNLISHPWKPTLYDNPILPITYTGWNNSIIWLHKQPLFLWQMALSMAIFGENEYALRLPDILMCTILVLVMYRMGTVLLDKTAGFLAATLVMVTVYLLELVSGRKELEHNDVAFLFYATCSIAAWVEYCLSGQRKWLIYIGLFSGMAVLCKWLVGLLIYAGWALYKIIHPTDKPIQWRDIGLSLLITFFVVSPWQLYTFWAFPVEAATEMAYNAKHFFEVVEGHGGGIMYHIERTQEIHGRFIFIFLPLCMYSAYHYTTQKSILITIWAMSAFVLIFFTLAATKMPSFTLIASGGIWTTMALGIRGLLCYMEQKKALILQWSFPIIVITIVISRWNGKQIQEKYTHQKTNYYAGVMASNKNILKDIPLGKHDVLFNVGGGHYVEAMFYTSVTVYPFLPSDEQLHVLQAKGYHAVILSTKKDLPTYLTESPIVRIIPKEIIVLDS